MKSKVKNVQAVYGNVWVKKTWTNCSCDTLLQFVQVFFLLRRYLESFRQGQKLVIILENELFQNLNLEQF